MSKKDKEVKVNNVEWDTTSTVTAENIKTAQYNSIKYTAVQDSGERTEFSTGAVRDCRAGKGRFDLLPIQALFRVAHHYENGAVKYGDNNWRKGIPLSKYYDSAIRHALKYWSGMEDEDHLSAAIWNLMCLLETESLIEKGELPKELNDKFQKTQVE